MGAREDQIPQDIDSMLDRVMAVDLDTLSSDQVEDEEVESTGIPDFIKALIDPQVTSRREQELEESGTPSPMREFGKIATGEAPFNINTVLETLPESIATIIAGGSQAVPKAAAIGARTAVRGPAEAGKKFIRSRLKGKEAAGIIEREIPKLPSGVKGAAPKSVINKVRDQGSKIWSKESLSGPNPSQLTRMFDDVPVELTEEFRRGAAENLAESLRNMPRITKAAQKNLTSEAGRKRLRETFKNMEQKDFDTFMSLLERGRFQEWRDWTIRIAVAWPFLRDLSRVFGEAFRGN